MIWFVSILLLVCIGCPCPIDAEAVHCGRMQEGSTHSHTNTKIDKDYGLCPVMHGQASERFSYTFEGKEYHFCCQSCIDEFRKAPEYYISRIKEFNLEASQFGYSPKELVVNKGDIVRLLVTSRDVPHGVSIKEYGIDTVVGKGELKRVEFVADKAGKFDIRCSVYCGKGHNKMKAKLVVRG